MIKEAVLLNAENGGDGSIELLSVIGDRLLSVGVRLSAILTVEDDRRGWFRALDQSRALGDLVIGIGKAAHQAADALAQLQGQRTEQNDPRADAAAGAEIKPNSSHLGSSDFDRLRLPKEAAILRSAAGIAAAFRTPLEQNRTLIWLSGVAGEIEMILEQDILPWIKQQNGENRQDLFAAFKIYGLAEAEVAEIIGSLKLHPDAQFSIQARYPDLILRISTGGPERTMLMTRLRDRISAALGPHLYAQDESTLEEIVGRMLLEKRHTLALAESCTGGYISHRITRVAGSSAYYYGGAVTYSNAAKVAFLGVAPQTLEAHGAVSRETALEMSQGIKNRTAASIGLSVTGIAGPGGGSAEKPVGTVWISITSARRHEARLFQFEGSRERIINGASQAALYWLRSELLA